MCIIISQVNVVWNQAFEGYLPSKTVFQSGALYTCKPWLAARDRPRSRPIFSRGHPRRNRHAAQSLPRLGPCHTRPRLAQSRQTRRLGHRLLLLDLRNTTRVDPSPVSPLHLARGRRPVPHALASIDRPRAQEPRGAREPPALVRPRALVSRHRRHRHQLAGFRGHDQLAVRLSPTSIRWELSADPYILASSSLPRLCSTTAPRAPMVQKTLQACSTRTISSSRPWAAVSPSTSVLLQRLHVDPSQAPQSCSPSPSFAPVKAPPSSPPSQAKTSPKASFAGAPP